MCEIHGESKYAKFFFACRACPVRPNEPELIVKYLLYIDNYLTTAASERVAAPNLPVSP